jgi:hypothetical protein
MAKRTARKKSAKAKPGPKAEVLKIEGNWEDAMKKSLGKKKPADGWPK